MKLNNRVVKAIGKMFLTILILTSSIGYIHADTGEGDELERSSILESSITKLFFYPINRLLDLNDIIHIGIAGTLGFGGEIAFTENASFGAYYTARESGIAYHGHRKHSNWLDAPPGGLLPPTPLNLIPGVDSHQRTHQVNHGYATRSFGKKRYETHSDDDLHFKRFSKKAILNEVMPTEEELGEEEKSLMKDIDTHLHKDNEGAIRLEIVAGLIHPYIALELHELVDFAAGLVFLDPKVDDWKASPGRGKLRKLGRGLSNIGVGILEVPINIYNVNETDGGLAAVTYGTSRGVWRFLVRSLFVGPWEVLTFPTSTEPIIEPEFMLTGSSEEYVWRVKYK